MPKLSASYPERGNLDTLFDGRLRVVQELDGYRFSLDAVLLADFVRLGGGERVIDLGTGVGIIPLILAQKRGRAIEIVGVEIQKKLAALAQANVRNGGVEDLIHIHQGDIKEIGDLFPPSSFDVVVSNPPYYRISSGRVNPSSQKAIARHEIMCTLDDVLQAARYLLKEGGRIVVIFPAHRSITLFASLRSAMLEPKALRWVYSREKEDAKFILTDAYKRGGEGVEVLPPFFVYAHDGTYTPEMARLYSDATMH
jgi:tRNA1Val (adenine37-N6)-methyltransferase